MGQIACVPVVRAMNVYRMLGIICAISLACLGQGVAAAARPNVVIVLADDQGYGDLSIHGNPHVKTPNIDRLAKDSIRFDRFYVSPLCSPTRASLLTGRYSLRTGVKDVSSGGETMRSEEVTLAEALRDAGYRTGIFGKWHNGECFPYTPRGQGFDEFFGFTVGHWDNYFDTTLKHNGKPVKTQGFIIDVQTDAAMQFIEANRNRPFFCYVAYNTPHSPLQVPDKYFDRYKALGLDDTLACVYGMCANIDDNVARLESQLERLGLRKNTIFLYLSDNGPNGNRFNGGMRGAKGSLHEGGSRVPCFLSWPARFTSPLMIRQIAAHIDLFPTLLDLCNAPMPKTLPLDGRSLAPLLGGDAKDWPDRVLFCQHWPPRANGNKTGALRTQRYRLVNDGRGWELFDMVNDPGETCDIGAKEPELKRKFVGEYEQWWTTIEPDLKWTVPPMTVGYAEENPSELTVPQSQFDGGLRFCNKFPNNSWLTNWTNATAKVQWNIDVVRDGMYEVSLLYLCPKADAGARVSVSVGDASAETTVPATPIVQVPLPDRVPRSEAHEMEWCMLKVGALRVRQGKNTLTVRALSKPGQQVMDLKSVIVERLE